MTRWQRFVNAVDREQKENKSTFFVYVGLRFLVIVMLILQLLNQNYENVFLCILTLFLMVLPAVIQATFRVEFPSTLEIIILVFIFSAEILGEISSFYSMFPHWDAMLHTINGFLCAAVGFSLVELMNRQRRIQFELSPLFVVIVAFCFSMTIGVLWEVFEFGMDMIFGLDMQKDTIVQEFNSTLLDPAQQNNRIRVEDIEKVTVNGKNLWESGYLDIGLIDTMYDLIVNFIGAFVFSIFGYFYIVRREAKGLIKELVLEPWSEEKLRNAVTEEMEEDSEKNNQDRNEGMNQDIGQDVNLEANG